MRSNNAHASPTFLQALSVSERSDLLNHLSGTSRIHADVVGCGGKARAVDATKQQLKGGISSAIARRPDLIDASELLQELSENKAALRAVRAEADNLIRDNRELSTEVIQLRRIAASERDNASALDNRVAHLQALYVDSFDKQNSLQFQHQASLNAKLDQLATPEVLAATQPPAEFPVPAPHTEPKSLGSAVTEINKLRKQLVQAQTLLAKAEKQHAHCQQRLRESQSKRKVEKAGYQREMAGMQSRLLGAMRRLVYVADKVAVKEAAIAERDAYVNRLEQQLVTKSGPSKRPPCKSHRDTINAGKRRQNRRCQSSGPPKTPAALSPVEQTHRIPAMATATTATERNMLTKSPGVASRSTVLRPVIPEGEHSEVPGYRQKHEVQSQARLGRHGNSVVKAKLPGPDEHELNGRSYIRRFDSDSLVGATFQKPSAVASGRSVSPHSGFTGCISPGPSSVDEQAWDDYRDALDAMQRRIDAMGPMLDAYDAPELDAYESQLRMEMETES